MQSREGVEGRRLLGGQEQEALVSGELEVDVVGRVVVEGRRDARHARPRVRLHHRLEERRQHAQPSQRRTHGCRQPGHGREEVQVLAARIRAVYEKLGRGDIPLGLRPAPGELG